MHERMIIPLACSAAAWRFAAILDIKPYVPYADSLVDAQAGYATDAPVADMPVEFTDQALVQITAQKKKHPELQTFISQVLAQDPRPAYKKNKTVRQEYGVKLYDFNVRWAVEDNITTVFSVTTTIADALKTS